MSENLDLTGRVKILEHGFHKLESRVDAGFSGMEKSLRALTDQIAAKGSPTDWRAILGTAVATAGLVAYLLGALNAWYDQKAAPLNLNVQRIADQDKNGELAVLKYRVQELERKNSSVKNP